MSWYHGELCTKWISCVRHHSATWNSMLKSEVIGLRRFNLLMILCHQNCQRSNPNSKSEVSSYFRRIAYQDPFFQMHPLCQRHIFNFQDLQWVNLAEFSGQIQWSVSFTPGTPGSRRDYDGSLSRKTHLPSHERRYFTCWTCMRPSGIKY